MTYKDVSNAMTKLAAAQRKEYVQTKLASIIADAPKKLEQKKQRKADVQVKVASIIKRIAQPEQRKAEVQTKVASIVKKAEEAKAQRVAGRTDFKKPNKSSQAASSGAAARKVYDRVASGAAGKKAEAAYTKSPAIKATVKGVSPIFESIGNAAKKTQKGADFIHGFYSKGK